MEVGNWFGATLDGEGNVEVEQLDNYGEDSIADDVGKGSKN